ncbi:MAG TPA: kelch repeat-containing protein [Candidatus Sulfotelmatobacter sp.]|jgi:hypothetical protein
MKMWRALASASFPLTLCILVCFPDPIAKAQVWTQYGPAARFAHTAVFDPVTKKMIIFGGQDSTTGTDLNDVWLVDTGTSKFVTSTSLSPTGSIPSGRFGHVSTYDPNTNRMTVFGGGTGRPGPCVNDAWILDAANGQNGTSTWIPISAAGAPPAARLHHTGVYDPNTNSLIVFGGSNCSTGYFNDVWVLSDANGESGSSTWMQLAPSGTPPAARQSASAIYDPVNNVMTVYGGDAGSANFGDVWVLSNANGSGGTPVWTQLSPTGTSPAPRSGQTATYDSTHDRMTIFGGFHLSQTRSDTFVLTFANGIGGTPAWSQIATKGTAPAVGFASAVYDSSVNDLYVFAGSSSEAKLAGDDHAFTLSSANGLGTSSWTRGGPPARYSQSMFYDAVGNSLFVMFGEHAQTNTNFDDYWQSNGVNDSSNINWIPINVQGAHPKARWGQSAAYDSVNNRAMVFGGATGFPAPCVNDYWVMTTANNTGGKPAWVAQTPTGTLPGVRMRHSGVYDPATNRLIVFGGFNCQSTYYNDVWVLSNANAITGTPSWTKLTPTGTIPSARQSSSAIYNSSSNTLTIYGGDAGAAPFGDIWILFHANGTGGTPQWKQANPTGGAPVARSGHTATYDVTNDLMTIYGGYDGTHLLNDTWVLSDANGNGVLPKWTQIIPLTTAPARRFASAVYDPIHNQINIFGGVFELPSLPDDHLYSLTNANGQP